MAHRSAGKIPVKADRIRDLRLQRGLTQAQLAEKAGLATRTINFLENGRYARLVTITLLAGALECKPEEIADLPGSTPPGIRADDGGGVVPTGAEMNSVPPLAPSLARDETGPNLFMALPEVAPRVVGRRQVLADLKGMIGIRTEGLDTPTGVVLVHGWPGVGKSTLAAELAYDDDVSALFEAVLWVRLGPNPNIEAALQTWGQALKLGGEKLATRSTASEAIRKALRGRRALLILDDVWTADHAATFLLGSVQTAAVVTTRERQIADLLGPYKIEPYLLPVLECDEAVALLEQFVPEVVRGHADDSRDLVATLEFLPLALVVAGQFLKRHHLRNASEINTALCALRENRGELFRQRVPFVNCGLPEAVRLTLSGVLDISFQALTDQERRCFKSLWPMKARPAKFSLDVLCKYWKTDAGTTKAVADALVDHGLMEPAGANWLQMHALLLDYAQYLSEPTHEPRNGK